MVDYCLQVGDFVELGQWCIEQGDQGNEGQQYCVDVQCQFQVVVGVGCCCIDDVVGGFFYFYFDGVVGQWGVGFRYQQFGYYQGCWCGYDVCCQQVFGVEGLLYWIVVVEYVYVCSQYVIGDVCYVVDYYCDQFGLGYFGDVGVDCQWCFGLVDEDVGVDVGGFCIGYVYDFGDCLGYVMYDYLYDVEVVYYVYQC